MIDIKYVLENLGLNSWIFRLLLVILLLAFLMFIFWQIREPVIAICRGLKNLVSSLRKKSFKYKYMGECIKIMSGSGASADDALVLGTKHLDAAILSELAYIRYKYPRHRIKAYAVALHPMAAEPYEKHDIFGMETSLYIGDIPPYSAFFDLYMIVKGSGRREKEIWFDTSPHFNGEVRDQGLNKYVERLSNARKNSETGYAVTRHLTCLTTLMQRMDTERKNCHDKDPDHKVAGEPSIYEIAASLSSSVNEYLDERTGVLFPEVIGELIRVQIFVHDDYDLFVNYENDDVKLSLYIYTRGIAEIPEDVTSQVVVDEFEKSLSDIKSDRLVGQYKRVSLSGNDIRTISVDSVSKDFLFAALELDMYVKVCKSILAIRGECNNFVKIRMSYSENIPDIEMFVSNHFELAARVLCSTRAADLITDKYSKQGNSV